MAVNKPIAFIIGAGQNIGAGVANALRSKGYRIALASRSAKNAGSNDDLHLATDLSKPETVSHAFASLRKQWGEPNVVLYNAAGAHFSGADDPVAPTLAEFSLDLAINTTSVYAAIKESLAGFDSLPNDSPKVFLYTGNKLNEGPAQGMLTLGLGKVATAQIIELASGAYAKKGYRFYYVDERKADGASKGMAIDGPAHGEFVATLVDGSAKAPWQATFVAGKGYVKFPRSQL